MAAVPGYAAKWMLEQGRRGRLNGATVRAQVAMWRGQGRADLASQLETGWAQMKLAARVWEDDAGLPAALRSVSAGESLEAKAAPPEAPSALTDEMSTKEAGAMLGVTAQRVGQMVKDDRLVGRRAGRALLVERASVVAELERRSAS